MIKRLQNLVSYVNFFLPDPLALHPIVINVLNSGVKVRIDSSLTLQIYSEIFVNGSYTPALDLADTIDYVVDLGANRGMFMLFTCHYLRARERTLPQFLSVEAAPENVNRLKAQVQLNKMEDNVELVCGAITERRSGFVEFTYAPGMHGMGSVRNSKRFTSRSVPVVDLSAHMHFPRIDVLKVDIEGSEEAFLMNYRDILDKTNVLVGEFHLKAIDITRCRQALADAGLTHEMTTDRLGDYQQVDIYRRK